MQSNEAMKPQMPQMMADHRQQMGKAMAEHQARMGEAKQMMQSPAGSGQGGHRVMRGGKGGDG